MANILIVGADQGIGYYLVERLLEVGNSVTVLDRQTEHVEMLKERYPEGLLTVLADACDASGNPEWRTHVFGDLGGSGRGIWQSRFQRTRNKITYKI